MKYFERRHRFIRANSVHSSIDRKMKKCPEICTLQDFVDVCDKSGAKTKPMVMQHYDFYEFENDHRNKKSGKLHHLISTQYPRQNSEKVSAQYVLSKVLRETTRK